MLEFVQYFVDIACIFGAISIGIGRGYDIISAHIIKTIGKTKNDKKRYI